MLNSTTLAALLICSAAAWLESAAPAHAQVRDIGSRLEPLVDDWLIQRMQGAELRLHHPVPREVVMAFDRPWEGNVSAYVTVFRDGDVFRMYYRGADYDWSKKEVTHQVACYAESTDGIQWTRPALGLCEFEGSKRNNIVWTGVGCHNFAPFKDANPNCRPDARYKALATGEGGLVAFQSADGVRWSLIQDEPVITKGAFDSQNLGFWDAVRGRYVEFHRGFRNGVRDIMTSTSEDFIHWTDPQWLDFGGAPPEHLYTNAVTPYFRAPHVFLGFPKRFMPERKKIEEHPSPGLSDGVFMTSRDGLHWHRFLEAFIRPGLQRERWWERNNMTAWGIVVTRPEIAGTPDELSLYSSESYYEDGNRLRRFALRVDGFVSVHAPFTGGEFVTRPLRFEGKQLLLNYSTSAAGSVRVEIGDEAGQPIPGFALDDCPETYSDSIEEAVRWKGGTDVSALAGRAVRLRFVLKDADLYAIRFAP
jgi:hypothetical protein